MPKQPHYRLLLDENISPRSRFPILNSRHDIKHLTHDFNKSGVTDREVYNIAKKTRRLILTFNKKHFEKIACEHIDTGVIAVSANIPDEQIDKKITSLLSRKKKNELYRKFNFITFP